MLFSLRAHLLLTYGLVIGVVLCVVGSALLFYILRNPLIDCQNYIRIEQAADFIIRQEFSSSSTEKRLPEIFQRIDKKQDIRVLILSPSGEIIHDSRNEYNLELDPNPRDTFQLKRSITIDNETNPWLFIRHQMDNGGYLVGATPRIRRISLLFSQRVRDLFKDDLLPSLLQGGTIALIASMILAICMSHWVVTPLRDMMDAAEHLSVGEFQHVREEGPQEVRKLAHAFNQMTTKVVLSQQSQKDFVADVSHELKTP
jgi:methyl-accepting chemotaxis protein